MAVEMAQDNKSINQIQLWERIEKDEYMAYAVAEAYNALEAVLKSLVNDEAKTWLVISEANFVWTCLCSACLPYVWSLSAKVQSSLFYGGVVIRKTYRD